MSDRLQSAKTGLWRTSSDLLKSLLQKTGGAVYFYASPLMPPKFTMLVDGVQRAPSSFGVPEMSLSSARSQMEKRTFVLSFEAAEVAAHLDPIYAAWVIESKKDDEQCGAPQDELAKAGYPRLDLVLNSPSLLELVMGHYLFNDLFGPQTWDARDSIDYWFDQVIACTSDGGSIKVAGICYSKLGGRSSHPDSA